MCSKAFAKCIYSKILIYLTCLKKIRRYSVLGVGYFSTYDGYTLLNIGRKLRTICMLSKVAEVLIIIIKKKNDCVTVSKLKYFVFVIL